MATNVKIVLDTRANSKKDDNTFPIILRLWHKGTNRTICPLGYYAKKLNWDDETQSLLKSYTLVSNITRTNNFLTKQRIIAFDVINDLKDSAEIDSLSINELNALIRKTLNGNNPKKKIRQSKEKKSQDWETCKTLYLNYINNIDVPKHKQRLRSKGYIKDTTLYLNRFDAFLKDTGREGRISSITQITDNVVGKYYEHLEKTTSSSASFNHHLRTVRNFFNFLIEEKGYQIKNPFRKVALRYEGTNPKTITNNEFKSFLKVLNEENGIATYQTGIRKNMYRPYLKFAYLLTL